MSVWDSRKEILYSNGSIVEAIKTTPLLSARSMAQSAMTVERDLFNAATLTVFSIIYSVYNCHVIVIAS